MSWSFIIWFFIGLGVYLLAIGLIAMIKYIKHKKQYNKELEEHKEDVLEVVCDEEKQNNDSNA